MRVVQLCHSFSPTSETFVYDLCSELINQNTDVHVVTRERLNAVDRPFENVHLLGSIWRWNPLRVCLRLLAATKLSAVQIHTFPLMRRHLRQLIKKIAPAIIHAQFGPMGVLAAPVARELGIPLVVTFHGFDVYELTRERAIADAYVRLFRQHHTLGLAVSESLLNKLLEIGIDQTSLGVLHNGTRLAPAFKQPMEVHKEIEPRTIRVLFVGRLMEVKSPLDLLKAFTLAREELRSSPLRLELTLVGDGALRAAVDDYVRQERLESCVHVLGCVRHDIVGHLMSTHHIYAQHNRRASNDAEEGLGVSLIEAHAYGLPVIGTRSGGVIEVVSHGETGFLVTPGDVDAMAARLIQVAKDPVLRRKMGENGRALARQKFDIQKQAARLIEIYEKLLCDSLASNG